MSGGARGGQRGNGAWACGWVVTVALLVAMCALALVAAVPPAPVRAAGGTYYVGSTDGANSVTTGCADAANTTCTLRGAVAQNGTDGGGGTVRFSSMFPATPTSITLPGEQTITKNLMIDGTGHRVTINGGGSGFDTRRLFTVNGGVTFAVTGITLTGGNLNGGNRGGAIFNSGTLTVTDSTLSGNSASLNGGGIYNLRGMVTLRNSTISGNSAPLEGGGIWNFGTVNAANTLIVNNGPMPYGEVSPYGIGTNIRNLTGPFAFANGETTPQDHGGPTTPTATDAYQRGDLATCNAIPPDGTPGGIYDGRGAPRVVGGTCSIGAYEPGLVTTATTVTANSTGGPFGTSVTFTATVRGVRGDVPPDSTATVTFTNGTTALGTANLTGGTATYTTATLPPGNSVTATYTAGGAGNPYASSPPSNAVSLTITPISCTVGVVSSSAMGTSVFGQSVTFTATVMGVSGTTPTGSVQFAYTPMGGTSTNLGTPVTLDMTGKATVSTSILPVGSDTITATYSGDGNYLTSSGAVTQSVNKASTTTSVTAMPPTSTFGQSVTLTATVAVPPPGAGTPTGTVTFTAGSTALGTGTLNGMGVAIVATTALPAGANQTITATYSGNANMAGSTGTTSVTANPTTSTFGSAVTLTATVTSSGGTPTGGVTFTSGGTSLGSGTLNSSGVATVSTAALPAGANQTITATYGGNTTVTGSTGTATVTVNAVTITLTAPTGSGSGSGNSGTGSAPSIRAGSSITLRPNPGTGVIYTSSNPNVAAVDLNTGAVTGISGGTAVITAGRPNGATGTITVMVMGGMSAGLMAPAPAPMVHTGAVTAAPGATVPPQPMSHATGNGTGGGVQPQAVRGPTAPRSATGTALAQHAVPLPASSRAAVSGSMWLRDRGDRDQGMDVWYLAGRTPVATVMADNPP